MRLWVSLFRLLPRTLPQFFSALDANSGQDRSLATKQSMQVAHWIPIVGPRCARAEPSHAFGHPLGAPLFKGESLLIVGETGLKAT